MFYGAQAQCLCLQPDLAEAPVAAFGIDADGLAMANRPCEDFAFIYVLASDAVANVPFRTPAGTMMQQARENSLISRARSRCVHARFLLPSQKSNFLPTSLKVAEQAGKAAQ